MAIENIYIKLKDLNKLIKQIEKDEHELLEKQASLAISKRNINMFLSKHRNEKMSSLVILPKDFIPQFQDNSIIHSAFSWKKMITETIELFNKTMSVNEIFQFGNVRYPIEMSDRRKSIKNISAVLCSLIKEGKISKVKIDTENCKYGISIKHFDLRGNPKIEYT